MPLFFSSCLVLIPIMVAKKSTQNKQNKISFESQDLGLAVKPDIFKDYQWAKPDVKSVPIQFANNKATVSLNNVPHEVTLEGDRVTFTNDGKTYSGNKTSSANDCYYDAQELKIKEKEIPYWETTWKTVYYTDYATRNRTETRTRSYMQNGQMRTMTETVNVPYSTPVQRSRTEPSSEWITKKQQVYDIPKYVIYPVQIENFKWLVYEVEKGKMPAI
jgi:hypothetical protein